MKYQHFDSLHEFQSLVPHPKNKAQWDEREKKYRSSPNEFGTDWFGVESPDAVIRVCQSGWQAGAARIKELAEVALEQVGTRKRRRMVRGDFGNEVDIHRIYSGRADNAWSRPAKVARPALAQVTLLANIGALGDVTSEQMFWRGAALLRACDLLSDRGHDIEIVGYNEKNNLFVGKESEWAGYTVVVKRFGTPVDLPALASTFCLAGFHRWYGFRWCASLPRRVKQGWGASSTGKPSAGIAARYPDAIVVPSVFSRAAAEDWLRKLEQQLSS